MRTMIITIVIMLSLIVLFACQRHKLATTQVIALTDLTEKHLARPVVEEFLSAFHLENKWNGAEFKLVDLTDVSYNQTKETKLVARDEWFSNEIDRESEIEDFKVKVTDIIASVNHEEIGREYSIIFEPMANELNALKESPADRKILIIYSDLMENTNEISFYRNKDLQKLKTDPESVRQKMEKLVPLKSLQGISIYFIYQPADIQNDQIYRTVSEFYREWFESLGATVNISANLNL